MTDMGWYEWIWAHGTQQRNNIVLYMGAKLFDQNTSFLIALVGVLSQKKHLGGFNTSTLNQAYSDK